MSIYLSWIVVFAATTIPAPVAGDDHTTVAEIPAPMVEARVASGDPRTGIASERLCPTILGSGSKSSVREKLAQSGQGWSNASSFFGLPPKPRAMSRACIISDRSDPICRPAGWMGKTISGDDR